MRYLRRTGEQGEIMQIHVPDYLILPFGRAVKADLQKIALSAVSADGLYFSTDVPVISIRKSDKRPMCLADFELYFGAFPDSCYRNNGREADQVMLDYIWTTLKSHNPNMTTSEELFLDLYFATLKALAEYAHNKNPDELIAARKTIGLSRLSTYKSTTDLWRALLPIPELQLYVQDPLAEKVSYQPDNNFRVDYGFWNGENLIAVEIDGAEPAGYARDIRRDRLLRRAGVDVIHITNWELGTHKAHALTQLLPRQFFGFDWNYEGERPDIIPF
jgi:hypothetical protein